MLFCLTHLDAGLMYSCLPRSRIRLSEVRSLQSLSACTASSQRGIQVPVPRFAHPSICTRRVAYAERSVSCVRIVGWCEWCAARERKPCQ